MKTLQFVLILSMFSLGLNAQNTSRSVKEAKGIAVGEKAPLFTAQDANKNMYSLEKALKKSPVVVIFYRGHWCPVCNQHLATIQDSLQLIYDKGAQVIAVSPQNPEHLNKMEEKAGVKFTLLYDEGYKIADAFDVTFLPEKRQIFSYNTFLKADLKKSQSDDSQRLPIPATFIIGQDGKIVWRHFEQNYQKRSSVKDIVDNLP